MKVLEKENVMRMSMARYVQTERDVLVQVGSHKNIVDIDFAF